MSHSNAIEEAFDMLETGMVDGQADAQDKVRVLAKQALYEAVTKPIVERLEKLPSLHNLTASGLATRNALNDVLEDVDNLFGISKEGEEGND